MTLTTTSTRRTMRSPSLSIVAHTHPILNVTNESCLLTLPAELILNIIELALLRQKSALRNISLVCRRLHAHANNIIYRTVVLHTRRSIFLFWRTTSKAARALFTNEKRPYYSVGVTQDFLWNTVKRLAIIEEMGLMFSNSADELAKIKMQVANIIESCSGAKTVALCGSWAKAMQAVGVDPSAAIYEPPRGRGQISGHRLLPAPTEIVLGSFGDLAGNLTPDPASDYMKKTYSFPSTPFSTPVSTAYATPTCTRPSSPFPSDLPPSHALRPVLAHVTHFRVCEPSPVWHAPSEMLAAFPNLTHIALSRRAYANEDNDAHFVADITALLAAASSSNLKMIVVCIFPLSPWSIQSDGNSEDAILNRNSLSLSNIWWLLTKVRNEDRRLHIVEGKYHSWTKEWMGESVIASADGPGDWWRKIAQR